VHFGTDSGPGSLPLGGGRGRRHDEPHPDVGGGSSGRARALNRGTLTFELSVGLAKTIHVNAGHIILVARPDICRFRLRMFGQSPSLLLRPGP
jgi:hypothetical protein